MHYSPGACCAHGSPYMRGQGLYMYRPGSMERAAPWPRDTHRARHLQRQLQTDPLRDAARLGAGELAERGVGRKVAGNRLDAEVLPVEAHGGHGARPRGWRDAGAVAASAGARSAKGWRRAAEAYVAVLRPWGRGVAPRKAGTRAGPTKHVRMARAGASCQGQWRTGAPHPWCTATTVCTRMWCTCHPNLQLETPRGTPAIPRRSTRAAARLLGSCLAQPTM